jgi:hypothetical protein
MNCRPWALPTFFSPDGSNAGPPFAGVVEAPVVDPEAAAGEAAAAGAEAAAGAAPETKPHPVLPFCVCAPGPEQMPDGPAQHPLPQSAALKHWPPMNCRPLPFPTFFTPEGSKAGPPFAGEVDAPAGTLLAAAAEATATAGEDAADGAAPPPKPHPVFPACVEAPGPEQMPVGLAQHPLPQSASLRHWPPMNWAPCALPTFLAPAGSNGGTAHTVRATLTIVNG